MPNPLTAKTFEQAMDPADVVDFKLTISQGDDDGDMLQSGENVASYTLTATAEAVAAGLQVLQSGGRQPALVGNLLQFWLSVQSMLQSASLFGGAGVQLAIELTVVTTATPARTRQRTILITVAQQ